MSSREEHTEQGGNGVIVIGTLIVTVEMEAIRTRMEARMAIATVRTRTPIRTTMENKRIIRKKKKNKSKIRTKKSEAHSERVSCAFVTPLRLLIFPTQIASIKYFLLLGSLSKRYLIRYGLLRPEKKLIQSQKLGKAKCQAAKV